MKGRDYLWCLVHTLLDGEEALERLCPACRARVLEERCSGCGRERTDWGEAERNGGFDWERFEALRGGNGP